MLKTVVYKSFSLLIIILLLSNCFKHQRQKYCSNTKSTKHQKALFLIMGQSNAANYGKTTLNSNWDRLKNFYDGDLFPLNDSLKGANATGWSVWTRWGSLLIEIEFTEEIIFAPVAAGGVPLNQFLADLSLNDDLVNAINKILSLYLLLQDVVF